MCSVEFSKRSRGIFSKTTMKPVLVTHSSPSQDLKNIHVDYRAHFIRLQVLYKLNHYFSKQRLRKCNIQNNEKRENKWYFAKDLELFKSHTTT